MGEIKSLMLLTDAFSSLLLKDALNMWSFPQRGLLCRVSLDPRPHRLRAFGNSSADSSLPLLEAEMSGAAAGALLEPGDLLWCPCMAVEVSFQVVVVLLSTLVVSVEQLQAQGMPGELWDPSEPPREGCALPGKGNLGWLSCSWAPPEVGLLPGARQSSQGAALSHILPCGICVSPIARTNLHEKL